MTILHAPECRRAFADHSASSPQNTPSVGSLWAVVRQQCQCAALFGTCGRGNARVEAVPGARDRRPGGLADMARPQPEVMCGSQSSSTCRARCCGIVRIALVASGARGPSDVNVGTTACRRGTGMRPEPRLSSLRVGGLATWWAGLAIISIAASKHQGESMDRWPTR